MKGLHRRDSGKDQNQSQKLVFPTTHTKMCHKFVIAVIDVQRVEQEQRTAGRKKNTPGGLYHENKMQPNS